MWVPTRICWGTKGKRKKEEIGKENAQGGVIKRTNVNERVARVGERKN